MKTIRIVHRASGTLIAEGPRGWGITSFDGGLYIQSRYLKTDSLRANFVPGFCPYKFMYVWLDLRLPNQDPVRNVGWKYWLPNPLLPFIWYRAAISRHHTELEILEEDGRGGAAET